ncbi:MAG: hypothetical protein GY940_17015 [bacterium]|nr:hypothetical protein [bacterium]
MNKLLVLVIMVVLTLPGFLAGELLSRIGDVDTDALETIKGEWAIEGRSYTLVFTTQYACRVDGVKYFHYSRSHSKPAYPWVYTIIKSKKTGKWYFARGNYRGGKFYGTTSRMMFENRDHFIVYSSKDPEDIFFKARRFKEKNKIKKP